MSQKVHIFRIGNYRTTEHKMTEMKANALHEKMQLLLASSSIEERRQASATLTVQIKKLVEEGKTDRVRKVLPMLNREITTLIESQSFDTGTINRQLACLLALSTTAIALGNAEARKEIHVLLPPILRCCETSKRTRIHPKIRYHASEALFNLFKALQESVLVYLDDILKILCSLAADPELNIKMGAVMVDKLLKEVALEAEEDFSLLDVPSLIPLLHKYTFKRGPSGSRNQKGGEFDWKNDTHCVQFLLLSWLDLAIPQLSFSPENPPVPIPELVAAHRTPTGPNVRIPHLVPVLQDVIDILLLLVLVDKETKTNKHKTGLTPSQMAQTILERIVRTQIATSTES